METWRRNLIESDSDIREIFRSIRTVAVLGIKPESHRGKPAHFVPAALAAAGLKIIPVPVYYPEVTEILGRPVYRKLAEIPEPIDLVDVFRRPVDIPPHVDDMIAAKPGVVWFQSGIRHQAVAETLAREGIKVVQSRCLMVEYGA